VRCTNQAVAKVESVEGVKCCWLHEPSCEMREEL
jgi:hypothetical protein